MLSKEHMCPIVAIFEHTYIRIQSFYRPHVPFVVGHLWRTLYLRIPTVHRAQQLPGVQIFKSWYSHFYSTMFSQHGVQPFFPSLYCTLNRLIYTIAPNCNFLQYLAWCPTVAAFRYHDTPSTIVLHSRKTVPNCWDPVLRASGFLESLELPIKILPVLSLVLKVSYVLV